MSEATIDGPAGTPVWPAPDTLPVHPERVLAAFITALRALPVDAADQAVLLRAFQRFVLERMGLVYGALNLFLAERDDHYI